jgi:hypothetical protein
MKRLIAVACVAFTLGLSGSPASADGVPGAWLVSLTGSDVSGPSKLAMGSMRQCVKALRGKGQFWIAAYETTVRLFADGSEIPDWVKLDNKIFREWAERADHVGIRVGSSYIHYECIRAK